MRRKYGNRPTEWNGELYPSKAEAERARNLEMLKRGGQIAYWHRGTRTQIIDGGPGRRVFYTPDFVVCDMDGAQHAEDVKGSVPRDFRMRAILYELQTGVPLRVVDSGGAVIWTPQGKRKRGGR